jgi:uncharacterized membrane protein
MTGAPRRFRSDALAAGCLLLLFCGMSAVLMAVKPVWYDEFYTLHLARFDTWAEFLDGLKHGGDLNPPLLYLLPHLTLRLFGDTHVGLRLPFAAAYVLAAALVYRFAARRLGSAFGLLAMVVVLVKFRYAFEARSAALVLAASAVAVSGWLSCAGAGRRRAGLVLLWLGCSAAVSSHYYGVLLLGPIGLAEIARSLQRKRIDWAVWGCLVAAFFLLVSFLPIIRAVAGRVDAGHMAAVQSSSLLDGYLWYVGGAHVVLAAVGAVLALRFLSIRIHGRPAASFSAGPLPAHEWVLWAGLALLPALGYLLAATVTKVCYARYFISALPGLAFLVAWICHRAVFGRAVVARLLAGALFAAILAMQAGDVSARQASRRKIDALAAELRRVGEAVPIITLDFPSYPVYVRYMDPEVSRRIVCVFDPDLRRNPDRGLYGLARRVPYRLAVMTELATWPQDEVYAIEQRRILPREDAMKLFGD